MSYEISNNTSTIRFLHNGGQQFLVTKWAVKGVGTIQNSIIKLDTGNCQSSICINYKDVTIPVTASITALVNLINTWLGDYSAAPGGGE